MENHLTELSLKQDSIICLSHNDLLLGNIIFNPKTQTVKIIDYEYGSIDYQAYDIANHFNEFAGVDNPDYKLFPSKEYQMDWLKIYLDAFINSLKANADINESDKKRLLARYNDKYIEDFLIEVNKFTMASHMMWAVWSIGTSTVISIGI